MGKYLLNPQKMIEWVTFSVNDIHNLMFSIWQQKQDNNMIFRINMFNVTNTNSDE